MKMELLKREKDILISHNIKRIEYLTTLIKGIELNLFLPPL